MPIPLFNQYGRQNQNNPVFNMFGNVQNFKQNFGTFVQNFNQQARMTPQQKVQELLDSGQMTPAQFEQLRAMANQILGQNR